MDWRGLCFSVRFWASTQLMGETGAVSPDCAWASQVGKEATVFHPWYRKAFSSDRTLALLYGTLQKYVPYLLIIDLATKAVRS